MPVAMRIQPFTPDSRFEMPVTGISTCGEGEPEIAVGGGRVAGGLRVGVAVGSSFGGGVLVSGPGASVGVGVTVAVLVGVSVGVTSVVVGVNVGVSVGGTSVSVGVITVGVGVSVAIRVGGGRGFERTFKPTLIDPG